MNGLIHRSGPFSGPASEKVAGMPLCGFYEAFSEALKDELVAYQVDYDYAEIRHFGFSFPQPILRGAWWSLSAWGGFRFYVPAQQGRVRFDHGKAARTRLARRQKLRTVENLPRGSSAR